MAPTRRKQTARKTYLDISPKPTSQNKIGRLPIRTYVRRTLLSLSLIVLVYFMAQWYSRIQAGREQIAIQLYTIKSVPGRGKGAFATRDIKAGELIIREKPFFILPTSVTEDPIELLNRHIQNLSTQDRETYFDLSHHASPLTAPNPVEYARQMTLSIFQTNTIMTLPNRAGLFPRTARLNHACVSSFNCIYAWREHEDALVTHALKRIKKGEELTFAYFNTRQPRSDRQAYLLSRYNFNCTCSTCSLPAHLSQASDDRIKAINERYIQMAKWQLKTKEEGGINGREAVKIANEIWQLYEEEGYLSERGQLASDMVHVATAHSDIPSALAWARLAEEWFSYVVGADSPQVQLMRKVTVDPKNHWAWGMRESMNVGTPDLE